MSKKLILIALISQSFALLLLLMSSPSWASDSQTICSPDANFQNRRLADPQIDNICQTYADKVMLIVNTASRCGYTDQYDDLEAIYRQYKDQGLVVVGFPSNDFGGQEPGTEKNIQDFCRLTYGVQFPMYAKTKVIGIQADPLYKKLTQVSGQAPRWNFYKYLIGRNGKLINVYQSSVAPKNPQLLAEIEKQLKATAR